MAGGGTLTLPTLTARRADELGVHPSVAITARRTFIVDPATIAAGGG